MLYLHPYYEPGAQLSLDLRSCVDDTECNVQATVVKAFTPFTMSQVLLVKIDSPVPDILPEECSTFVLKVYDPRFLQHRKGSKSSAPHPWTLAAETTAAKRRIFGAETYLPTWWPADSDTAGWEEYYHANLQQIFKNELSAYNRLLSLQGTSIPHCFAHGQLVISTPPLRMVVPHVLLLSYIPGPTLRAVNPARVPGHVARSIIDIVRSFGILGVVHDDLRADNVLVSPSEAEPTRAVFIDFGNATVRASESDEEWERTLAENSEPTLAQLLLDKLGIKLPPS
ncbi:hypothetical protein C8J57DRAFT_1345885 [Mycena rebaudengoi]|nr:hypothetical protein C8J57DRAFT_1345885 [Mycena rebaudengoi]